jgi:hypothetical protein
MTSYKMGVMFGNAVKTGMVFPGNPLKIYFDSDVKKALNWIEDEGLGHHWMAAYGDLRRQLTDFAGMIGCQLSQF